MSAAKALPPVRADYSLTITTGERAGKRYKLAAPRITIGRASENDISIEHDVKCSRQHAVIEYGVQGYEIESLSDKNPVIVDGREVSRAPLRNGAQIQLGETHFSFIIDVQKPEQSLDLRVALPPPAATPSKKKSRSGKAGSSSKSPVFKIVVGGVILFFIWILTSQGPSKTKQTEITSSRDIEAEIEAAKQIESAKRQEAQVSQKNTVQYQDAQANYVRGFRDYKKGQFARARDSFQTCLSLFPEHVLCNRYLNLSNRKFNEIVQYHTILGRDYRDRNQFRSCMNSFKTVMVMVKDQNSQIYQQAKANYDACSAQLGERF